jgi:hypothetical protein
MAIFEPTIHALSGPRPLSHGKCSWNLNFLSGKLAHKPLRIALT